jgi:hypothetical protein
VVDAGDTVRDVAQRWPGVTEVRLIGSRARGAATALSDWDFVLEAADLDELMAALPRLVEPLDPLAAQWDRLSEGALFMLVLPGGEKIDLFPGGRRRAVEPPWRPGPDTLAGIDAHLWDWLVWLGSKVLRGEDELVADELEKLHHHLLGPLGADRPARSVGDAAERYLALRDTAEARCGVAVDRRLGEVVLGRLRDEGVV